jgi:hypothetical protein
MKCEYNDGLKIDYSGSLTVRKGNEIRGVFAKKDSIPAEFKYVLDKAARDNSCVELRNIVQEITRTECGKVCLH